MQGYGELDNDRTEITKNTTYSKRLETNSRPPSCESHNRAPDKTTDLYICTHYVYTECQQLLGLEYSKRRKWAKLFHRLDH